MNRKLFVASLPYEITGEELLQVFAQVGRVVSAKIIVDHNTGKSRGFGFVEMSSHAEAEQAIKDFNGLKVGQRHIVVSSAKSNDEAKPENFSTDKPVQKDRLDSQG